MQLAKAQDSTKNSRSGTQSFAEARSPSPSIAVPKLDLSKVKPFDKAASKKQAVEHKAPVRQTQTI